MTADHTPRHKVVYYGDVEDFAQGRVPSHAKELKASFTSWGETARGDNPPESDASMPPTLYLRRSAAKKVKSV